MPGALPAMKIVAIEARAQISATQHVHLDRSGRTIVEGNHRVLARDVEPGLADFVLHAREDVLSLVAEVRRLRDLLQDHA